MFISISTLLLVSTCFSVTFVHLFLHAYLSTSRFHYETSRRFILKPTRVIRWLFLVIAFPLLPEDLKILFTLKIDFSRSQRFPIDYLQLAVNNEHGTLWRNIDLSELSNVSRWRDGWKKSPVDMTNVVPFRDKSYDTRIDFDIPVGNKKKKKRGKRVECTLWISLISLRILLTRVIVSSQKEIDDRVQRTWQKARRQRGACPALTVGEKRPGMNDMPRPGVTYAHDARQTHPPSLSLSLTSARCRPPSPLRSTNLQTKQTVITRKCFGASANVSKI